MAKSSVSRCVIETFEGRTLMSAAPIFGQHPMIIVPNYQPEKVKSYPSPRPTPPPVLTPVPMPVPPPVSSPVEPPVQPELADAPDDLKARASRRAKAVCLKWDSVAAGAKTIVIEASTNGEDFTTVGMLDADEKKFRAKNLDKSKTYTFRVYTLDENDAASELAEVTPKWKC